MALGLGAAIGLGTGILQTGLGLLDRRKAKKEREAAQDFYEANKYQIPEGVRASLQIAERNASRVGLPAEDLRRSQLAEATAQGVGASQAAATSSSDVLNMVANLYGQQMRGEQNLAIEAAQDWQQRQQQLQRTQEMFGGYEDIQWQQNVLAPYQQRLAAAGQYSGRGAQGLSAGLGAIGSTIGGVMQQQGEQNRFNTYMDYLKGQ